jgi:hypothetical protein
MSVKCAREPLVRTEPARRSTLRAEIVLLVGWLIMLALGLYLHPEPGLYGTHTQLGLPPCGFLLIFGKPCPTCGLTTSFSAMAHLRPVEAFEAHPGGPLLFAFVTMVGLACGYSVAVGRRYVLRGVWLERAFVLVMALTLSLGVVRLLLLL